MEEKQKNEKQAMGMVWLVGILVIFLGATIVYTMNLRKEIEQTKALVNAQNTAQVEENKVEVNKVSEENKIYTVKTVKGKYVAKTLEKNERENDCFYLLDDGTYQYEEGEDAVYGYYGTYTIDNNKITLYKMFSHGSDIGVSVEDNKKIIGEIKEDGSIVLNINNKNKVFNKKSSSVKESDGNLYNNVGGYLNYLESELGWNQ